MKRYQQRNQQSKTLSLDTKKKKQLRRFYQQRLLSIFADFYSFEDSNRLEIFQERGKILINLKVYRPQLDWIIGDLETGSGYSYPENNFYKLQLEFEYAEFNTTLDNWRVTAETNFRNRFSAMNIGGNSEAALV